MPKRTIKKVFIEDFKEENPQWLTASELLAMHEDIWGKLRDGITDYHSYKKKGLIPKKGCVAYCRKCGDRVYISVSKTGEPFFKHFAGSNPNCPWYWSRKLRDPRAAQYQGQQESPLHRRMCKQIAELVALDERCVGTPAIGKYLPSTDKNERGRFPDVHAEWKDFGEFVIEFQLSNTFQIEISERINFYEKKRIPLLWILGWFDPKRKMPQSFRDVIRQHRNNAFVLDKAAIEESRKRHTLVLTCYLLNKTGDCDTQKPVRFDKLHFPKPGLPYHLPYCEDRIVKPRLKEIKERRLLGRVLLEKWEKDRSKLLEGLKPPLDILFAAAYSIVSRAAGKEHNYASKHPNVIAMLNTFLYWDKLSPYTDLLTQLIKNTAANTLLTTSVGKHLRRHAALEQKDEKSYEWKLLKKFFPEALDPSVRNLLRLYDKLPKWAQPDS